MIFYVFVSIPLVFPKFKDIFHKVSPLCYHVGRVKCRSVFFKFGLLREVFRFGLLRTVFRFGLLKAGKKQGILFFPLIQIIRFKFIHPLLIIYIFGGCIVRLEVYCISGDLLDTVLKFTNPSCRGGYFILLNI